MVAVALGQPVAGQPLFPREVAGIQHDGYSPLESSPENLLADPLRQELADPVGPAADGVVVSEEIQVAVEQVVDVAGSDLPAPPQLGMAVHQSGLAGEAHPHHHHQDPFLRIKPHPVPDLPDNCGDDVLNHRGTQVEKRFHRPLDLTDVHISPFRSELFNYKTISL